MKLKTVAVVSNEHVPDDMVYLGHTVKLLDLSDDTEQLVRLVGDAQPPKPGDEVLPVSVNSPMGEALMKARVRDGDQHLSLAHPERPPSVVVGLVAAGQGEYRRQRVVEVHVPILNRTRAVRVGRSP